MADDRADGFARGGRRIRLLCGASGAALRTVSLAVALGVSVSQSAFAGSVTVNPVQTSTYTLTPGANPITFGAGTNVDTASTFYGTAIAGGGGTPWVVTNSGFLRGNLAGVSLQSSSSLTNYGSISGVFNDGVTQQGGSILNEAGGSITSVGSANAIGIFLAASGAVTNAGTISGFFRGVSLNQGGSIVNLAGGAIGGANGVYVSGGLGSVTNASAISGTSAGVVFADVGGDLTNQAGGAITGGTYGVWGGGSGTVTNAGTISTTAGVIAVEVEQGRLINQAGGLITAGDASHAYGVGVDIGDGGSVTNAGTISGTSGGISLFSGGTVTNQAGGAINGGIFAGGPGTSVVNNAGAISGGIVLSSDSVVNNQSGGVINGNVTVGGAGCCFFGQPGYSYSSQDVITNQAGATINGSVSIADLGPNTVTNAGMIASNANGVSVGDGGRVVNQTGGTITGGLDGAVIAGGGSVTNSGAINGLGKAGVEIAAGDVFNLAGGVITGAQMGVYGLGGPVSVTNAGAISSVSLVTGDVSNLAGGTIGDIAIVSGAVDNAGSIAAGVRLGSGLVNNRAGGSITGYSGGVEIGSLGGSVTNAGTIAATAPGVNRYGAASDGVSLFGSGSVTNLKGGVISGGQFGVVGVYFGGASITVTNAGTITGGVFDGVQVTGGLTNQNGGVIAGGRYGVSAAANASVINQAGGQITGGIYGVIGNGDVTNAGVIGGAKASVVLRGGTSQTLTLQSGSTLNGDAIGDGTTALILQGGGVANNNFLSFNTLAAQGPGTWTLGGASQFGSTKISSGTLTVTGALTSAFTINSGAMLQGTTSSLLAQGAVSDSGSLVFDQATDGAFANAIVGTGGLIKQNSGALTLSGASTVGTTTVSGGSLIVTGALSSAFTIDRGATLQGNTTTLLAQGAITDNGTLVFDQTAVRVFDNAITGTGALIKQNHSALILRGTSSVGSTTVSSGRLIVTGALTSHFTINNGANLSGTTASLLAQDDVIDDGALEFDQAMDGTFANVITGIGGLTKWNPGALTLSGNSSVSSTMVGGGSLIVTGGLNSAFFINNGATLQGTTATLLALGAVTDNGTLVFDQVANGVFANAITGSGALIKQNAGLLALNGVSSVATTAVNAGNLEIGDAAHPGAQLTSAVTINAGAALSGHGAIVGAVTNNGGTVAPGGTIGVLTINGDYTQTAAGTLSIEVSPAASSTLLVTGAAHLDGGLQLVVDPGVYRKGTHFSFITAASVTGGFTSLTGAEGLPFSVSLQGNGATLTVLASNFALAGATANQTATLAGFNNYPVGVSDFDPVANAVIALPAGARQNAALDQLGGEVAADLLTVERDAARGFLGGVADQLSGPRAGGAQVWGQAYGRFGSVRGDGDAHGFSGSASGVIVGVRHDFTAETSLGAAISYGHTDFSLHDLSQSAAVDAGALALYGEQRSGVWFFDAAASVGYAGGDSTRSIALPGVARRAHGSFDGATTAALASVGARFDAGGGLRVEPSVGVVYSHVARGGYTESGAGGADLAVSAQDQDAAQSLVGVRFSKAFRLAPFGLAQGAFSAEGRVSWAHELGAPAPRAREGFAAAPGGDFTLAGADPGPDAALFGGHVAYQLSARLSLYGDYQATLSQHQTDHAVSVGARLSW